MRKMMTGWLLLGSACITDPTGADAGSPSLVTDGVVSPPEASDVPEFEPCPEAELTWRMATGEDLTGLQVVERLEFTRCNLEWGTLRQWAEAADGSGALCEGRADWQIVAPDACTDCDGAWEVAFGPITSRGEDCAAVFGTNGSPTPLSYDWLGVLFSPPVVLLDAPDNPYPFPFESEMDAAEGDIEGFRFATTSTYAL